MFKGVFIFIIATCSIYSANGATTKKGLVVNDDKIYFPGELEKLENKFGTPDDLPDECKDKEYCTIKPANYPQELYNSFFNGTIPLGGPNLIIDTSGIGDRTGDDEGDGCRTEVTFEPIFRLRTKRGWQNVIQSEEKNYLQKVRMETCKQVKAPCFAGIGYGPDIITECVQTSNVWEFVVDNGNGGTETISKELPICCSCHYRFNLDRIGKRKK